MQKLKKKRLNSGFFWDFGILKHFFEKLKSGSFLQEQRLTALCIVSLSIAILYSGTITESKERNKENSFAIFMNHESLVLVPAKTPLASGNKLFTALFLVSFQT